MKIKETAVYQFDELNEDAKERARDWYGVNQARIALDSGKDARYAYGFSTVHIVPVAKRSITK